MMDAEARLAEVSGDRAFARDFFGRYIQGHDVADYAPLLLRAGLVLRKQFPGRAWWGDVRLEFQTGIARIAALTPSNSPAYAAGLDLGDAVRQMDGSRVTSADDVNRAIGRHKPGDTVAVVFSGRTGEAKTVAVTLIEDPRLELVPIESTGAALAAAQKTFRDRWLGN
jgi:predicted metalloprotease with PDZ domain